MLNSVVHLFGGRSLLNRTVDNDNYHEIYRCWMRTTEGRTRGVLLSIGNSKHKPYQFVVIKFPSLDSPRPYKVAYRIKEEMTFEQMIYLGTALPCYLNYRRTFKEYCYQSQTEHISMTRGNLRT